MPLSPVVNSAACQALPIFEKASRLFAAFEKEAAGTNPQDTNMKARVLIVDDHEIVREGIRRLLTSSRPDWEICGEASDGKQAIDAVERLKPDVVVLDITMPGMNGLRPPGYCEAEALLPHFNLHHARFRCV